MIKFISTHNGRRLLGLVILKENVDYLKKDMPLLVNKEDLELPEIRVDEIIIMYFDTYEDAVESLTKQGIISEETKIETRERSIN